MSWLLLIGGLLLTTIVVGRIRWNLGTRDLRQRLEAARVPIKPATIDRGDLENLPAPVQRFFRAALSDAQPIVAAVCMKQSGTINMGKSREQWKPFCASQRVITRRPGFDWDARVAMMPGLAGWVHDSYVAGEGILHASLLGLFSLVNMRGKGEIARGELMRFLAEAVWYPTALLPSQGVLWEAVDDHSARATLADGETSVTLLFRFNEEWLIDTIHAETRDRIVDGKAIPTPWICRVWNYSTHSGMKVPAHGEVSWQLPNGAAPYWRGQVTKIGFEFATGGIRSNSTNRVAGSPQQLTPIADERANATSIY